MLSQYNNNKLFYNIILLSTGCKPVGLFIFLIHLSYLLVKLPNFLSVLLSIVYKVMRVMSSLPCYQVGRFGTVLTALVILGDWEGGGLSGLV